MNGPRDAKTIRRRTEAKQLLHAGRYGEAASVYRTLLQKDKKNPEYAYCLGLAERQLRLLPKAREHLKLAIKLAPTMPACYCELGLVYKAEGRFSEARRNFQKAISLDPQGSFAARCLADLHRFLGNLPEAVAVLEPFVARGGTDLEIALAYCRVRRAQGEAAAGLEVLVPCATAAQTPSTLSSDVQFELGACYDRLGEYDQAFAAFRLGNQMRAVHFDPADFQASLDALLDVWAPEKVKEYPRSSHESALPVFIVGMPRSGTSLVEQILAAHPAVHGAGELNELNTIVQELQGDSPHARALHLKPDALSVQRLDRRAAAHLRTLSRFDRTAERVTDKMPTNFFHLGLIHQLFPGAKVIHCTRDPLDTCLSCYFQNFAGAHPFAYDLTHLGVFFKGYQRLMQRWPTVLNLPMLEVSYEELVANQEDVSRRLLEFVELPWDDACLRFFESKRIALTASNEQVNQPMYRTSVARHTHYEAHLAPLRDALADARKNS